jgi:hypothetical protein
MNTPTWCVSNIVVAFTVTVKKKKTGLEKIFLVAIFKKIVIRIKLLREEFLQAKKRKKISLYE